MGIYARPTLLAHGAGRRILSPRINSASVVHLTLTRVVSYRIGYILGVEIIFYAVVSSWNIVFIYRDASTVTGSFVIIASVLYIYIDIFCKFCSTIYRNCKFCVTNLRTTCMRCTCNIHPPSSRGKKASRTAFKRLIGAMSASFGKMKRATRRQEARSSRVSFISFFFSFFLSLCGSISRGFAC